MNHGSHRWWLRVALAFSIAFAPTASLAGPQPGRSWPGPDARLVGMADIDQVRGLVIEQFPEGWSEELHIVPTLVPELFVLLGFPLVELLGGPEEATAGGDTRASGDQVLGSLPEALADPRLEGRALIALSLWQRETTTGRISLVGGAFGRIVAGEPRWDDAFYPDFASAGEVLRTWNAALRQELRTRQEAGTLRDPGYAAELAWYTVLSGDRRLVRAWSAMLMGAGQDCAKTVGRKAGCGQCCEDSFHVNMVGCIGAGALAATGACFVSMACGPVAFACCSLLGGLTGGLVTYECQRAVKEKVRACTEVCEASFDAHEQGGSGGKPW